MTEIPPVENGLTEFQYLAHCRKAPLEVVKDYLTTVCPECGRDKTYSDFDFHPWIHQMIGPFIAIACEGYWVINPNAVGISRPDWNDWTKSEDSPKDI